MKRARTEETQEQTAYDDEKEAQDEKVDATEETEATEAPAEGEIAPPVLREGAYNVTAPDSGIPAGGAYDPAAAPAPIVQEAPEKTRATRGHTCSEDVPAAASQAYAGADEAKECGSACDCKCHVCRYTSSGTDTD